MIKMLVYYRKVPDGIGYSDNAKYQIDLSVNSLARLREVIVLNSNSDFGGYITKDAAQNPEFKQMMDEIYRHKQKLHTKQLKSGDLLAPRIHDDFVAKLLAHFSDAYS